MGGINDKPNIPIDNDNNSYNTRLKVLSRELPLLNTTPSRDALMAKLVRRYTSNVAILSSNLSEGIFFFVFFYTHLCVYISDNNATVETVDCEEIVPCSPKFLKSVFLHLSENKNKNYKIK